MIGPGKYDDLCELVRQRAGVVEGGGVVVIVFGGSKGSGFSCQVDLRSALLLPGLLEEVADQIRADTE